MELVTLAWGLLPLLALWIVIYTAVRMALRHDREQSGRDRRDGPP
jgi:hypothetical protein